MSNVMQPTTVPTPTPRRFALGLPAGSVRALLALAVLGLLWAVALTHPHGETVSDADKHLPTILIALQILMVLILVHFFTAHEIVQVAGKRIVAQDSNNDGGIRV